MPFTVWPLNVFPSVSMANAWLGMPLPLCTPPLSLAGQVSAGLRSTEDGRTLEWGLTIVSATSLGSVGIFVEFRIDIPEEGTAPLFVHTGFTLPVGDRLQFDIHKLNENPLVRAAMWGPMQVLNMVRAPGAPPDAPDPEHGPD